MTTLASQLSVAVSSESWPNANRIRLGPSETRLLNQTGQIKSTLGAGQPLRIRLVSVPLLVQKDWEADSFKPNRIFDLVQRLHSQFPPFENPAASTRVTNMQETTPSIARPDILSSII